MCQRVKGTGSSRVIQWRLFYRNTPELSRTRTEMTEESPQLPPPQKTPDCIFLLLTLECLGRHDVFPF